MLINRWDKWHSRLMEGEPQFTQAQLDAAVADAVTKATGPLSEQLAKANETAETLAKKVATFEDADLKGVEKLQKQLETVTGERDTLKVEVEGLAKIRDDWHADLTDRWKGITTKLSAGEKTKKVLESGVFKKGDGVEIVQHNLAQYRELVASGLLVEDEATSSPDGKKTPRKDGDAPASAMEKTASVLKKQFKNE